jgi:glucosamine 6-phosphate synthetase-like amidotransferase/phosphosugar isomerase protein
MLNLFQYNIEETMTNERFVYEKWEFEERKAREVWENEQAIRRMMEEEKSENKMKAEEAESQGWECQVCYTEIDRDKLGLLECGHIFHPECINAYLKSKIESNEVEISCPMEGCPKHLDVGDIYGFIDGELK